MASKSITFQEAVNKIGVTEDPDATSTYNLSGKKPDALTNHSIENEYNMIGVTGDNCTTGLSGPDFDINKLNSDFKKICYDFGDEITKDVPSKALEFASKILFEVGPSSRRVKKNTGDKTWIFRFFYKNDNKLVIKTAFASTFKGEGMEYIPDADDTKISLTSRIISNTIIQLISKICYIKSKNK